MDAQSILNKVMGLLGVEKQVKLGGDVYAKLDDGSTAAAAAFSVGSPVFSIDGTGNRVPMEDGEYEIYLPSSVGTSCFQMEIKNGSISTLDLNDMGQMDEIPQNEINKYTTPPEEGQTNLKKVKMAEIKKVEVNPKPNFKDVKVKDIEDVRMAAGSEADMTEAEKKYAQDLIGKTAADEIQMAEDPSARLDALEAQVKQLRDDIASLFQSEKGEDAADATADVNAKKQMPQKQMMAKKKLTGAPASEKVELQGLFKVKNAGSFQTVLNRMNGQ